MTEEQRAEIMLRLASLEEGLAMLRKAMLNPPEPKWEEIDHRHTEDEFADVQ